MSEVKVYRIYDTRTSEYFESRRGKTVWSSSRSAKLSWYMTEFGTMLFDDKNQTRFILHQFSLVRDLEEVGK